MDKIEDYKQKQINDIVSVVKLASLLFISIIIFQYFFKSEKGNYIILYYNVATIWITVCLLLSIYSIWAFSTSRKLSYKNMRYVQTGENILFFFIFLVIIIISGNYASEYKYLFLFIIITTTIQSGMKRGILTACAASIVILMVDIFFIPGVEVNSYFENDLILSGVFILTAWPLGYYVKIEDEHIYKLKSLVNEDGLTSVYNHRYFHDTLKEKVMTSNLKNEKISMIFIDIDYFKHYNDLYGHQMGDGVLKIISSLLKENVREKDIVCRYGGEEFSIILPNTEESEALILADRLRNLIEKTKFYGEENQPNGRLTVSMGVSTYPTKAESDIDLIKSADDALYRAKFFYKNRVEAYTSILDEIKKDIDEKDIELVTSIKTLISIINAKDRYTYAHCERLVFYSRLLADELNLNQREKNILVHGAYMHDIGKINISKDILIKKMPLTKEEWELLKQHPQNGVDIIKSVKSLESVIPLILYHHEKYDGTGYPANLKGEEIPYLARILTVIDSFDAMTSTRPYNKQKTYEEAIIELEKYKNIQFDPKIVDCFIEVLKENHGKLDRIF
ncbi:diguanylate cyclase [Clostridium chauvoei]|uniref:Putative Diguanylate cyclase (GGDEF) domain protein n=1 Tax=Clostridium chauvoei JF4335 TaxID=1351755 RepID=S6FB94_9CLOT|nr:diguanylate cyclase [Clostridium chauvoei]MBX7282625.1 diguanylate cyclase [Clostridium chauvoei]MBX7285032.1 diguanylate cyclase [Clostridium chauvoei]MBX7287538.1 diguanylate cyclase [Clostridium chauvoei]MBX7292671.1 diguanylate cyclase [Clostridium chauvoei]MBX7295264.1 diguanylate cyclase [Clostridium chauvoei]